MCTLYVGLDLAEKTTAACLMLPDGREPHKRFLLSQNPSGVEELVGKILRIALEHRVTNLVAGMESTGLLWWHLSCALREHPKLKPLTPKVYCLNARMVANFKKAYAEQSKTDFFDAFVIADRLRFGRLPHPLIPDEQYLALQRLTRHRFHLVQSLAREKNRFLTHLYLKFPGFCQQEPLSNTFGAAAAALLTEFLTVDEIASQSVGQLADFLREKGRNHFPDPEKVAAAIQRAARDSYRLNKCLTNPVNVILSMTLENIRFFEKQIHTLDKAIEREISAFPNAQALLSIPGFGPVFTAGILAEAQDVSRFSSDDALAKFAAIVWKHNQSGDFDGDETPIMHTGNHYLRYYLIEAANSVRMHNDEYRAFYQTKYREATKHHHKRACVLTARKLVRLVYTLLRNGQLYQPPQARTARKETPTEPTEPLMPPGELARHIIRRRRSARGS